jgi:hypothetical protein
VRRRGSGNSEASGDLDHAQRRSGLDDPGPGRTCAPARSHGQALAGVRLESRHAVSKTAGIVIEKSSVLVLLDAAQRQ